MHNPDSIIVAVQVALGILALFNVYVSICLLLYAGLSGIQKVLQLVIIWLLPVIGALLVHSVIFVRPVRSRDSGSESAAGDNPPGMGSDVGHH